MRSLVIHLITTILLLSMLSPIMQAQAGRSSSGEVEIRPSIAIPGEIVEIRVDSLESGEKYEVWVEDSEGQYRFERHNQTTNNEVLTYEWIVSPNIPTGQYSLCLGVWDTDWWDEDFIAIIECELFSVMSRRVITETPNDAVLPGSTIVINGAITHPWTNEPIFSDRVEYLAEYFIDEDDSIEYRTQSGTLTAITGIFSFQFDIPLNVPQGDWIYSDIEITIWANGSNAQQSDSTTLVVECGSFAFQWLSTGNGVFEPGVPVLLEARAMANGYWEWAPLENRSASLSIWQDGIKRPIVVGLNSEARGRIQFMLDIGDIQGLHSGSAVLELQGSSPVDGTPVTANTTVFLLLDDDAVGQGVNVNLREVGGPWNPGDSAVIAVLVTDDADQPMPYAWVYWTVSDIDDDDIYYDGVTTSEIRLAQVDNDGRVELIVAISESHQPNIQDMRVTVIASNSTGALDEETITLNIEEPWTNIATNSIVFSPGDVILCSMISWGLEGDLVWIWQSSDGQSGVIEGLESSVEFSVEIPDAHDEYSWYISVEVIDTDGRQVSDLVVLQRRQGHTLEVNLPWSTPTAGDVIEVEYQLHSLEQDGRFNLPMGWSTGIVGDEENMKVGIVTSASGTIPLALPENMSSGSYLAVIQVGGASTYLVVDIADDESIGAANFAGDLAGIATPTLAIVALIIAIISMMLALRKKGRGDALGAVVDDAPEAPSANALPPPSAAPIPPAVVNPTPAAPTNQAPPPGVAPLPQPSLEQMAQGDGGGQQFPPPQ